MIILIAFSAIVLMPQFYGRAGISSLIKTCSDQRLSRMLNEYHKKSFVLLRDELSSRGRFNPASFEQSNRIDGILLEIETEMSARKMNVLG